MTAVSSQPPQQARALAATTHNRNLVPWIHFMEGQNQARQVVLWPHRNTVTGMHLSHSEDKNDQEAIIQEQCSKKN